MKILAGAALAAALFAAPGMPVAHADEVCQSVPRVVAVGPTSCPFAINVAQRYMNGAGTSFMAYSPTTGESYQMNCMIIYHGSTSCMGGNNARVDIY